MKISRRNLAKALVVSGTVSGLSRWVSSQATATELAATGNWMLVYPGVWRTTLGTPESYTPVSSRVVEPRSAAFDKLPRVGNAPLPPIAGRRIPRGFLVQLPLRPYEQVYGFGLQFLSFTQRGKKKKCRVNADPKLDTGDS